MTHSIITGADVDLIDHDLSSAVVDAFCEAYEADTGHFEVRDFIGKLERLGYKIITVGEYINSQESS